MKNPGCCRGFPFFTQTTCNLKYAFYTTICRKAQFRQGSVKPNQYGQISWAL